MIAELSKGPLIHLEDVYKGYDGRTILRDIDLKITQGEFCSVVGPSGCGKSTLLKLILGQEKPDSGMINISGKPASSPSSARGVVYQKYSLFPHLTVLENVMVGLEYLNLPKQGGGVFPTKRQMQDHAMSYLERVRLTDAAHKYPHLLSGGMQQRVAIAQAIIAKPNILLMDEPFGALDPSTREELQVFLLELWESLNLTVLFVTHSLEEACFVGTRLVALSQYYTSGEKEAHLHGATIVADHHLSNTPGSTGIKHDPAFIELIKDVRHRAFEPSIMQHINTFDLMHNDSFRT
jgi:NitT/TauT family transport system ATP-binding protein